MTRTERAQKAKAIWLRCKAGGRPNAAEKKLLLDAYYQGQLPYDADYSVSQWVEDEFPSLGDGR